VPVSARTFLNVGTRGRRVPARKKMMEMQKRKVHVGLETIQTLRGITGDSLMEIEGWRVGRKRGREKPSGPKGKNLKAKRYNPKPHLVVEKRRAPSP